jgi:alpha-tubulin suppressor-like RCC1 family protein
MEKRTATILGLLLTLLWAFPCGTGGHVGSRDVYWANIEANCEAAEAPTASTARMSSAMMVSMDDEDPGGDGGGDPCSITNLLQTFCVTNIVHNASGSTTITWQSCQVFRYLIFSANLLSTNTQWLPQAYVWGATNASATSWTDLSTTNNDGNTVTQRFYRVQRLLGSPIAAGGYHSLAVLTNGMLWAWGGDDQGQLGDGGTLDEAAPEPIGDPLCGPASLTNPVGLAAGYDFSVAVDANGVVWTWGDGGEGTDYTVTGQLGNGGHTNVYTPSPITGISHVVSVAAGHYHTLALCSAGTVSAWGGDPFGSGVLGAGGSFTSGSSTPIQSLVPTGTVIAAIAAGEDFSLAMDTTGAVWGWGDGSSGQLGSNVCDGCSANLPTPVAGISNVIAIAAGLQHSIAVTADNTLWTWGDNSNGELGRSGSNAVPGQVFASGLSNNVVAIAGGEYFTLAVTSNGQVFAFGLNGVGQLGANNVGGIISSPVQVTGISNAVLVSAHPRGQHSLAVTVNQGTNQYYGWGYNSDGQVGNGSGDDQDTPAQLYFCDACTSCVQLGTSGVFTAQCTGTLRLYFNDGLGAFGNNSGAYTATVVNVATNVIVMGTNGQGAVAGVVTNGGVYQYTATGYCQWDPAQTNVDANGDIQNSTTPVGCSGFAGSPTCPKTQCFSLVGRIQ